MRYDRWVIMQRAAVARRNPATTERIGRFFVNLSRDSVGDPQTPEFIRRAIAEAGIDPRRIGFEVTESIAIGNLTRANQLIAELRRLGCTFGLDDFGSGVSSFAYLKALSVDYLKIDGMFVGNISQDKVDYAMVRSITEIGHVMGKQDHRRVGRERERAREVARDRCRLCAGVRRRRAEAPRGNRRRDRGRPAELKLQDLQSARLASAAPSTSERSFR